MFKNFVRDSIGFSLANIAIKALNIILIPIYVRYLSFEEYGIDVDQPIDLTCNLDMPCQAKIGGFYTFQSKVEGTCIGQQHNAYSVRDSQGNVHVIYKHCIENITK